MNLYVIFDKKIATYLTPFESENDMSAQRLVMGSLQEDNLLSQNPEDFNLIKIGFYNKEKGELKNEDNKIVCEIKTLSLILEQQRIADKARQADAIKRYSNEESKREAYLAKEKINAREEEK